MVRPGIIVVDKDQLSRIEEIGVGMDEDIVQRLIGSKEFCNRWVLELAAAAHHARHRLLNIAKDRLDNKRLCSAQPYATSGEGAYEQPIRKPGHVHTTAVIRAHLGGLPDGWELHLRIDRQKPCRADCAASAICNKPTLQLCTNRVCIALGVLLENSIEHPVVVPECTERNRLQREGDEVLGWVLDSLLDGVKWVGLEPYLSHTQGRHCTCGHNARNHRSSIAADANMPLRTSLMSESNTKS